MVALVIVTFIVEATGKVRIIVADHDLSRLKKTFLKGTSEERLEAIKFINRNLVSLTHDESFIQALDNCAKDKNHDVRAGAASILGGNYIWGKSTEPEKAIEILLRLSRDEKHPERIL